MRRVAAMAAALAAVLVVTAVAFAQQVNTYDVTATTSPTHAGTKSKPVAAKYVKGDGGGTALQFDTPPDLLHPVAGLTTAVRAVQSTIKKRTVTKKGVKKGYYESTKCKGKNRPVVVTFTPESGPAVTA